MVRTLVELGADLNAVDPQGNTPLHSAVSLRRSEIVGVLVKGGANVDAQTSYPSLLFANKVLDVYQEREHFSSFSNREQQRGNFSAVSRR